MTLTLDFDYPFYSGSGSAAADVPSLYPIGLAGRGYLVDLKLQRFGLETIPQLRPQSDTGDKPSERSLNPEGLWRFGQESWHRGAGQSYVDREDSDPYRYEASKGIDVWTKWQMSLLNDTEKKRNSTNTNLDWFLVGTRAYIVDGNSLLFTTDPTPSSPSFTTVTGTPAATLQSAVSDGYNVWAAYGASGVYKTDRSASAAASYNALVCTLLGYAKGRLMAANGPAIYNIISTATPSAHFTHPNADFAWVGFAAGPGHIYAAGFSGDKTEVYRVGIKEDGTGLDVPIHAVTDYPDGEVVRSIRSYLGFILLGTDKGVRFCEADGSGNLNLGSLIETDSAVQCFEGQGPNFVWYGLTNFDGTSTGLGRMDLREFVAEGAPAYASDLMATAQGAVLAIMSYGSRRYFAVSGSGFWGENGNKVASGYVDSGLITYGLPDDKVALFLDVRYKDTFVGTHRSYVAVDGGDFNGVGTYTGGTQQPFSLSQLRGEAYEIREELSRDAANATVGPTITRHTLLSTVTTDPGDVIWLPVILAEYEEYRGTKHPKRNPAEELAFLRLLRRSGEPVVYQEGSVSYTVLVKEIRWLPTHLTEDRNTYNGTCLLKLQVISQ